MKIPRIGTPVVATTRVTTFYSTPGEIGKVYDLLPNYVVIIFNKKNKHRGYSNGNIGVELEYCYAVEKDNFTKEFSVGGIHILLKEL
jgi:hypothetical protein